MDRLTNNALFSRMEMGLNLYQHCLPCPTIIKELPAGQPRISKMKYLVQKIFCEKNFKIGVFKVFRIDFKDSLLCRAELSVQLQLQ